MRDSPRTVGVETMNTLRRCAKVVARARTTHPEHRWED